jgi:uncharacterized phosphosugar-binding protein
LISTEYFAALSTILTQIAQREAKPIQQAGEMVAEAIAADGVIHTFGSGHSHMIAEEAFFRAGGLAPVSPILDDALIFLHGALESTRAERRSGYAEEILKREAVRVGDVAIVISNSGRNAVPIEMAAALKARGVPVIAITNPRQASTAPSRHESGRYLYQLADVVIDNQVPVGDAVLGLPDASSLKMGPATTVAGAAIINAIMIEAAACLIRMGVKIPVLESANVGVGALADMASALSPWSGRIRLLDA